ncbi:hypothetical protein BH18ACT5_BH18ACT5_06620 [soil metagenome]
MGDKIFAFLGSGEPGVGIKGGNNRDESYDRVVAKLPKRLRPV